MIGSDETVPGTPPPLRLTQRVRLLGTRSIVANAASLFGATVVTSLLGFAFWAVAARMYSLSAIGTASAALSAMQLLATIGVLGLGTLIIGEVARAPDPTALVSTSSLVAAVGSAGVAVLAAVAAPLLSLHLGALQEGALGPALFAAGAALTGLTVVLDQACIGLLRGGLQFWRNAVFATTKLLLLPLGLLVTNGEVALYVVWAIGNVVSLATLYVHARRRSLHPSLRLRLHSLSGLRVAALNHHWLNLSGTAPRLLLPVIVVSALGARVNAAFYAALLIAAFINIVPVHLATALFALASGDHAGLRREARFSLGLSVGLGAAAGAACLVLARPLLSILGTEYTTAATTLVLLVASTAPGAVKAHYAAVRRVQGRLGRAALAVSLGSILEVALAIAGTQASLGLNGVTLGYVLAMVIEAIVLWPVVARAAGLPPLWGFSERVGESA